MLLFLALAVLAVAMPTPSLKIPVLGSFFDHYWFPDFLTFNRHYYLRLPGTYNFWDAIEEATNPAYAINGTSGHLLVITTDREDNFVANTFNPIDSTGYHWLALRDTSNDVSIRRDIWQSGPEKGLLLGDAFQDYVTGEKFSTDASKRCVSFLNQEGTAQDGWKRTSCDDETLHVIVELECPAGYVFATGNYENDWCTGIWIISFVIC
jgi:hypothetical protein